LEFANYYTLLHIANVLNELCAGKRIMQIYSQQRNQLCVEIEGGCTLVISCEPTENFLYADRKFSRARKNTVDLFPTLSGKRVEEISCHASDRIVSVAINDGSALFVDMYGSRANVLLCNRAENNDMQVADAFLRKKENVGTTRPAFQKFLSVQDHSALSEETRFLDALRSSGEKTILSALKKIIPTFGTLLAKEALFHAEVLPSASMDIITDRELMKIVTATRNLLRTLTAFSDEVPARVYYEDEAPVCFSLIPLRTFENYEARSFDDLNEAIRTCVGESNRAVSFSKERAEIVARLESELKKSERTLEKMKEEYSAHDRASEYELFGKLLMLHLTSVRKGMKEAKLEDSITQSGEKRIVLDPSLSPVRNAERYFDKAKKARAAKEETEQRIKNILHRVELVRVLLAEAEELQSKETLKQFIHAHASELKETIGMAEKSSEPLPPFRIFTVEGGFQVLAGKSSANNDLLTMKYAKQNDLWFHCRGSGGSHVVLRAGTGHGEISKTAIQQAAAIAAYYSKMKNASMVPVAMTEKKFVRKPRGAPAGTVTIDREKVIFVEPKLPAQSQ
jgi:predicted ribosome quality control (RQC) complex YloA/Tae2 family protein